MLKSSPQKKKKKRNLKKIENKESDEIFEHISFVKLKSSKLIN